MHKTKEQLKVEQELHATQLANEHWERLQTLLGKVYKDAFIHGYKHGKEGR